MSHEDHDNDSVLSELTGGFNQDADHQGHGEHGSDHFEGGHDWDGQGHHHDEHANPDGQHHEDVEEVQVRSEKPKKNQNAYKAAAAAIFVAALGLTAFIGFRVMYPPTPKIATTRPMSAPLDAGAIQSAAIPGGFAQSGQTFPVMASPEVPAVPASAPVAVAANPMAVASQPAVVTPPVTVPAVAATPAVAAVQVNPVVTAPAVQKQDATPRTQPAMATVAVPAVAKASPGEEVLDAKPQRKRHERAAVKVEPQVVATTPAATTTTVAAKPSKPHSKSNGKAKKEEVIETVAQARNEYGMIVPRFRIMAFLPASGQYQMAHMWDETAGRQIVVREGDVLPDGTRVTKIDALNWTIGTTSGMAR